MEPIAYLKSIRRRWYVLPVAICVAIAAGWAATGDPRSAPQANYEAKAVLLNTGPPGVPGVFRLKTVAALVLVGEVPRRVAEKLGEGDPRSLVRKVNVVAEEEVGTISILATDRKSTQAEAIANGFARELISFMVEGRDRELASQLESLTGRLEQLQREIADFDARLAAVRGGEGTILKAERDARVRQYGLAYEQYQQLAQGAATQAPFQLVQTAAAEKVATRGIVLPTSVEARLVLAGGLGLLLGLALILGLERFDSRIRTKRSAEQAFNLPVLAEIPSLRRRHRRRPAATRDGSVAADSFRILAAEMARAAAEAHAVEGNGHKPTARTILVTSAGSAEGKTTVVANLGVALSKIGKRVILLSCDFRRPSLHRLFNVPGEPGMAEALTTANGSRMLPQFLQGTSIEDVAIVSAGAAEEREGDLLGTDAMRRLLAEAAATGDFVLIDSAPVLASDTAHLVPEADAILVVARSGMTTPQMAERTSEVLKRLGSRVVGVALNCADELPAQRRYYRRSY